MSLRRVFGVLLPLLIFTLLFSTGCPGGDPDPIDNQIDIPDVDIPDVGDPDTDDPDTDDPDATDPDTDPDPGPDPVEPIACDNPVPTPADGDRCVVIPGSSDYILLRGTILAGDDVYEEGSLLLDGQSPNRRIACVGCECDTEPEALDATVIACPDGVISPGLINPHDHLTFAEGRPQLHGEERFDHRHDWRRGIRDHTEIRTSPRTGAHREGVLLGELRMLFGGATSIAGAIGQVNASGFLRNLDNTNHTEGIDVDVYYDTFPLGDGGGFPTLRASGCDYPNIRSENVLSADIYLPHVSEGIDLEARNELTCLSGGSDRDLIQSNTSVIHGIAVDARDVAIIAQRGANLVWSPRTNIDLYGNTAPVPLYHRFGVPISLGTDWSTSGSMNMLRELQCADYLNRIHYNETFTDLDLFKMATYNGAISLGVSDQLGLLEENYVGDITLFDGRFRSPYRAVIDAEIDDVVLVLRGGKVLYGDASILEGLADDGEPQGCEVVDVCGRDRRICAQSDTGLTLAQIWSGVHPNSYPMFYCGEPENEPSCVPFRPSEYSGISTPQDRSGDGVPDVIDNCPDYFNPIRPMDNGIQSDINGNGRGDVCDPCPLSGDPDCTEFDPDDWSGDGILNINDNCPFAYNPNQLDTSQDGVGDACHPCPEFSLLEGPCPGSIYEVKTGAVGAGEPLMIEDALVTASLAGEGIFIQVHPDDPIYDGPDNSGLYVFLRNVAGVSGDNFPAEGDRLRLVGAVSAFFGQLQMANISEVEVLSSGNALPDPVLVTPSEVATSGSRREALEGVLLRVEDLTVTDIDVPPGPGDSAPTNEFIVNDSLHVNNFFHQVSPFPEVGESMVAISGILRWANANSKLEPRSPQDVLRGPPELVALSPSELFIEASESASITVSLSRPAEEAVTVELTYSDSSVISGPATISFAPGEQTTSFDVQALVANEDTVTVEASLDEVDLLATVRTFDAATERALLSFGAPTLAFFAGETITLTAELNVPAPAGGVDMTLTLSPSGGANFLTDLTFDAGVRTLPVEITLGADTGIFLAAATALGDTLSFPFEVFGAPQEYLETFDNLTLSGASYVDGNFVGDAGFPWEFTRARRGPAAAADTMDGNNMIFGDDSVEPRYIRAFDIPGGISSFSIDMRQAFTGSGTRQLELFINGEFKGRSIAFGTNDADAGTTFAFDVDGLEVNGDFDIEIRSVGVRQIAIDNIRWISGFPVDPGDVEPPENELSAFGQDALFLEQGATTPLPLTFASTTLEGGVITLAASDSDALDFPAEVSFAAGVSEVTFDVTGLVAGDVPIVLTASLGDSQASTEITVFNEDTPRTLLGIQGCTAALVGQTASFTAEVDLPAGAAGFEAELFFDPTEAFPDFPDGMSVTFAPGETSATFDLTFLEPGLVDVFIDSGTSMEMITVDVLDYPNPVDERFDTLSISASSYSSGTYIGNYDISWQYAGARRASALYEIDDPSFLLGGTGTSYLRTTELPGGLESFSVDLRSAFAIGTERALELHVNGSLVATSQTIGADQTVQSWEVSDLGGLCVQTLELRNSPNDAGIAFDNLEFSFANVAESGEEVEETDGE